VKIYRILYERVITEQMDIPADKVGEIDGYDSTFTVKDPDNKVVAVIPTDKLIGCGLIELPDPPPAVSDEPGLTE
jgi:hypothetical protein